MVYPHGLINCGVKISRGAGIAGRQGCVLIAASIDLSSSNSSTREGDGVDSRVMIAASLAVDLGCTAKLGEEDDQRFVELASLVEIGQQG